MFFDIFNANFNCSDLYERLCYVVVTQNWEAFGAQYWIKQCIQMTLGACAKPDVSVCFSDLAAARFHFSNLVGAAASLTEAKVTDPSTLLPSSEVASESVAMSSLDTSLNESHWTHFKEGY